MNQVVLESPGRIVTLQRERREVQAPLLSFLFFKIPLSNPRLVSQVVWAVFVFQSLSALPCPQCRQSLEGAVGQTKLHKTKNLKTQARNF